jgi:hypothetical protein
MRIIVSLLDGNMRKGNVDDDTLIRDLAARLKLEPDSCLTLAGVSPTPVLQQKNSASVEHQISPRFL